MRAKTMHARVSLHISDSIPQLTLLTLDTDHQRIAKIDRENEVAPPPKVPPTVGKVCCSFQFRDSILILSIITQAMKEARMEKDLSQKELAQKANQKPSVIQDIESGKAITDHNILMKLERILGVKLRGG